LGYNAHHQKVDGRRSIDMRRKVPARLRAPSIILLVIGLFLASSSLSAQQTDAELGRKCGTADARAINRNLLKQGIFLHEVAPGMVLLTPWTLPVKGPESMLLGRSSEYVDAYLKAFKDRVRFRKSIPYLATGAGVCLVVVGSIAIYQATLAVTEACSEISGCIDYDYGCSFPVSCVVPY
jgi:hypothetical protein